MSGGYDSGAGDPDWGFDAGAGDPQDADTPIPGMGAGNPVDAWEAPVVPVVFGFRPAAGVHLPPPPSLINPSASSVQEVGEEGGYILHAISLFFFPRGTYRIYFVDVDSVAHPLGGLPAYSAIAGQGGNLVPTRYMDRVLTCSTPPMHPGVYAIRLVHPNKQITTLPGKLYVYPAPYSAEVEAVKARLPRIYEGKG